MNSQAQRTRADRRREATRARIVQAARELVVERGYGDVSTADVIERAGVSRGAIYHHFESKTELFAAVIDALEADFIVRMVEAVADQPDPFSVLRVGAQWYLDEAMRSTELQRVGLLEGRRALDWDLWRETIFPHGFSVLVATVAAAMDAGQMKRMDPRALAQILLAGLIEATGIILASPDPAAERVRTGEVVAALIEGLAV